MDGPRRSRRHLTLSMCTCQYSSWTVRAGRDVILPCRCEPASTRHGRSAQVATSSYHVDVNLPVLVSMKTACDLVSKWQKCIAQYQGVMQDENVSCRDRLISQLERLTRFRAFSTVEPVLGDPWFGRPLVLGDHNHRHGSFLTIKYLA